MIQLTKTSSGEEIKAYFNAVLKLAKVSEKYPVNLDEVWMLVYNRRDYAVDSLKKDFIENEDFVCTSVKTEVGSNKFNYYLTVSCLEYFIVKKVRHVFEVYRKVFHKSVEYVKKLKEPTIKDKIEVAKFLSSFLNLNDSSKLLIAKSIADPLGLPTPDYTPSRGILKSASELLKESGSTMSAQAFNARLVELGYLTELSRPSSKGGVKKFKSITAKGLEYGENQVNPNNPKSTQPLWYADRFNEFMNVIK